MLWAYVVASGSHQCAVSFSCSSAGICLQDACTVVTDSCQCAVSFSCLSAGICLQDTCMVVTDSRQCAVVVFFVLQRNMFTRHMHGGN